MTRNRPHEPDPVGHEAGFSAQELEASLERLGIRELEERMEVSPLLIDTGAGTLEIETTGTGPCCVCKINTPDPLEEDGMLPFFQEPPMPTGPTNPGPWPW